MLGEVAVLLERVRRADQKEAQRIARDEAFKQRLVHAGQVLTHFEKRILRRGAELHGDVVGDPVQVEDHGVLFTLRENCREVDRHGGCPHTALGPDEGVDLAQLTLTGSSPARRALQARDGLAKLGPLQPLHDEIVGAGAQRADHGFSVGVIIGNDHVEIGRGLLHLFQRFQADFGVSGQVHDQGGVRVPLEVLQHADVQVLCNLLVLGHDLAVGDVHQAFANRFPEVLVGACD